MQEGNKKSRRALPAISCIIALKRVGAVGGAIFWVFLNFLAFASSEPPLVLLYQEQAPLVQRSNEQPLDPNVAFASPLATELRRLGKVEVVVYSAEHPTAQRIAREQKLLNIQLRSPDLATLRLFAREWDASYLLIVSATRNLEGTLLNFKATLWQAERKEPTWNHEGSLQAKVGAQADWETMAHSAARTLALRLNAEVWGHLPVSKPTSTPPGEPSKLAPPAPSYLEPAQAALERLKKGDHLGALPLLRLAVNQAPLKEELRLKLIETYRHLGQNEQAQQECQRSLSLFPDRMEFVLKMAELLQEGKQPQEARRFLQQFIAQNPQALPPLLALCDLALAEAEFKEAWEVCEKARALAPDSPEVRWRLYLVKGAQGLFEQAIEAFPPLQPTLTPERYLLFFKIAEGILTDLALEVLDLRKLLLEPTPPLGEAKPRCERLLHSTSECSRWLEMLKPEPPLRVSHNHLRLSSGLLNQAAHSLARYLLTRQKEESESASLYRSEALRELQNARSKLQMK